MPGSGVRVPHNPLFSCLDNMESRMYLSKQNNSGVILNIQFM